jgi:hypothetical protein
VIRKVHINMHPILDGAEAQTDSRRYFYSAGLLALVCCLTFSREFCNGVISSEPAPRKLWDATGDSIEMNLLLHETSF